MPTHPAIDLREILGPVPTDRARRRILEEVGYHPHPEQAAFHFGKYFDGTPLRYKLVAGGEQAGKSYSAAMEMLSWLPWGTLFWLIGPDYSQTSTEFRYLQEALEKLGALSGRPSMPEKGGWKMRTIWGAEIVTKSAKDTKTIAGRAPDGILLVEAAQAPVDAFLRAYGRTAPKRAWLCINGTFEKDSGSWYREIWKKWQSANKHKGRSFSLPTWTNRTFYPGGYDDEAIIALRDTNTEDFFLERYAGIPTKPQGIVFPEFSHAQHVKIVERQPGTPPELLPDADRIVLPEETEDEVWVDPGWAHGYAVLFVTWWQNIAVIYDEIYVTLRNHEEVAQMALRHPRWQYVNRIVMDVAGQQHQMNASAFEVWKDVTGLTPVGKFLKVQDGVARTRISMLPHPVTQLPGIMLGSGCVKTQWELSEGYRYRLDNSTGAVIDGLPVDKNNHASKALAYGLVWRLGLAKREKRAAGKTKRREAGWELFDAA